MGRTQTIKYLQDVMEKVGGCHPLGQHIRTMVAAEHVHAVCILYEKDMTFRSK